MNTSRSTKSCVAAWSLIAAGLLSGCTSVPQITPGSGPTALQLESRATTSQRAGADIQVVPIDHEIVRRLGARQQELSLVQSLRRADERRSGAEVPTAFDVTTIGPGDFIEISLWEAPPAMLFGTGTPTDLRGLSSARPASLPEQMVDAEGKVMVPFIGRVSASGRTPSQLQELIVRGLIGKANQPQAIVRVTRQTSSSVTVVGEVATSLRLPLTPRGERLLDALAAAGGVRHPVNKVSVQLTRRDAAHALPLESLIRDPQQNIALQPGDVITALVQPLNFTVLGATGRNDELPLEAQGISLAQALARAGGLNDNRADARGVFVFRMEDAAVAGVTEAHRVTSDGKAPVVYSLDLRDPGSFFAAQGFQVQHRDVLYVANAPGAELQKFLNLLWGTALPAMSVINATR